MKKIKIDIPNNAYNVYLGNNIFTNILDLLKKENLLNDFLLVIDKNVDELYSSLIDGVFNSFGKKVNKIIIEATEKKKNFESVKAIHSTLIKYNYGRDSIIIAIGGGIIGDVAGFAASTYMRGIKYVQIPTTLLASVDSSVGGKTGINFEDTKNIIGSFYQPKLVLIDTQFFGTLQQDEILCGLGEIVKYAFLLDSNFYSFVNKNISKILSNDFETINKVIYNSVKFKGSVVTADEKESGIRKILNLGHTFAHAFEVQQKHKLKHGQAVIVGITCAIYLSHKLNFLTQKNFENYLRFLTQFSDKIKLSKIDNESIMNIMQKDKKNRNNKIKFVLIQNVGNILTDVIVEPNLINQSITEAVSHF